ncbi:hypothetical protein EHS17_09715 [Rhodobacteraceae bacterium CH30]|nr:hypothetical protein EHS17_09715 [Rhodobacteraceae bacterium CH30]
MPTGRQLQAKKLFALTLISAALAACGGGGGGSGPDSVGGSGPSTPGQGGGTTVTPVSPLTLSMVDSQSTATNRIRMGELATLRIQLKKADGSPLASQLVKLTLDDTQIASLSETEPSPQGLAIPPVRNLNILTDDKGYADAPVFPLQRGAATITAEATVDGKPLTKAFIFAVDPFRVVIKGLEPGLQTLPQNGSTAVTAEVTDSSGKPVAQAVPVTFWSECSKAGKAKFNGKDEVTLNTSLQTQGNVQASRATANYTDAGCDSSDTLYAKVQSSTESTPLTIQSLAQIPANLTFMSATPPLINLKGMGNNASTLRFKLADTQGNPLKNASVSFKLNTAVGGLTLSTTTDTTDSNGVATVQVLAGTIGTPVRVTATTTQNGKTVSVQSSELIVSTGLPHQNGFSLSVSTANPEFLNIDNQKITLSVGASDRAGNPVPDGTAIGFKTEAGIGRVDGGCITKDGTCSVNFVSSGNRTKLVADGTLAGRQTIVANMIGEESFADSNGNGSFDADEKFGDLPQAYIDMNQDGKYNAALLAVDGTATSEEPFTSDTGATTSAGDGCFNGELNKAGTCNASTTVRDSVVVVWSGSIWHPERSNTHLTLPQLCAGRPANVDSTTGGDTGTLTIRPQDINGNPMPAGTTITFTSSINTAVDSLLSQRFTVPSQLYASAYSVDVSTASCNRLGNENIKVTTKTPSGVETIFSYPVR